MRAVLDQYLTASLGASPAYRPAGDAFQQVVVDKFGNPVLVKTAPDAPPAPPAPSVLGSTPVLLGIFALVGVGTYLIGTRMGA